MNIKKPTLIIGDKEYIFDKVYTRHFLQAQKSAAVIDKDDKDIFDEYVKTVAVCFDTDENNIVENVPIDEIIGAFWHIQHYINNLVNEKMAKIPNEIKAEQ